jgi:hypothetical protein
MYDVLMEDKKNFFEQASGWTRLFILIMGLALLLAIGGSEFDVFGMFILFVGLLIYSIAWVVRGFRKKD